jgi:hypothetical protein
LRARSEPAGCGAAATFAICGAALEGRACATSHADAGARPSSAQP